MRRINARQIISPETELRDREKPGCENAPFEQIEVVRGREPKHEGDQQQPRNLEQAQQFSPPHDIDGQHR